MTYLSLPNIFCKHQVSFLLRGWGWLRCIWLLAFLFPTLGGVGGSSIQAQTSDSLIVRQLREQGVTFSHNNSVMLLTSGQEKFQHLFEDIREAKSSIHLEYFNFRNDSIAHLLFNLLAEKAKQGVEVRALFDGFGNFSNNRPLKKRHIKAIREKGIQIYQFNPVRFPWIDDLFNRDHRKIVIIDGQIAYTGGMNVADYYINGTEAVGPWRDLHCRITGDEVNTLQNIFLRMWKKVTKQEVNGQQYFTPQPSPNTSHSLEGPGETSSNTMVGIINREPHTSNKIIRQFYLDAINDAHDSITIINPYLTLNHKLKKALKNAVKRGVNVNIMISQKSDIPLTPDCAFYNLHKLMKHGANVWIYQQGFHHTKTLMVDGRFCTIGSANLNSRSLRWDYEENAVIIDTCVTQKLCKLFNDDKKDSFPLTEESWNAWRTPWKKFVGWFANLLTPFL